MSKVVTANELARGTVVFLGVNGKWVASIDEALVFADAASAEVGLASAKLDEKRAIIVDPFIVDRKDGVDGRAAMTTRDAIRAYGPTINYLPAAPSVP